VWIWAAINPTHHADWVLENVLVVVFIPILIWSYYKLRLSHISYTLIFIFMVLHTIGSHYTYAEVPFGFWLQELLGFSRNHYDRIVHFSFGLLLAYPVRELFLRVANARGVWGYWLPVELTLAYSAVYEIIEWIAAISVDPGAGTAFLGTQGDPWDAIKDMALAGTGALIAMLVAMYFNWRYNKRFAAEMERSIEVKRKRPLGEVRLGEMEKERKPKKKR
jgi:putative membrane protein